MVWYFLFIFLVLIYVSAYDIKTQEIQNFTIFIIMAGGITNLAFRFYPISIAESVAGAFGAGISFLILAFWGMGGGDVKLIFALGLSLGYKLIIPLMLLSFILGAIFSVFLILIKKKTAKEHVPFAPYISLATGICMVCYEPIMRYYERFAGIL